MKIIPQVLLTIAIILTLGCTYAERYDAGGSGGEIIVKFVPDHAISASIPGAFDDPKTEASIAKSVQTLSTDLGVPFVYSRLTSGHEIVIGIPAGQIYELLTERILDSDDVQNAALEQRTTADELIDPVDILVTVDNSKVEVGPNVDVDALAAHLVDDDRFPVFCNVRSGGQLAIAPDFDQLMKKLVKKLEERPDVEYAQENYQVRHYDRIRSQ